MARPQTKKDLLTYGEEQYQKLLATINIMTEEEQKLDFCFDKESAGKEAHWTRDENMKDVLIHLYEWHQLVLNWVDSNQKGENKPFIPEPYNWKTYGKMNIEFWEKHQNTSYEEAKNLVEKSHKQVMDLVDTFSNEELFEKKYFSYTGGTNLGSYFVSATTSHYDWAMKKIKKQIKALKKK